MMRWGRLALAVSVALQALTIGSVVAAAQAANRPQRRAAAEPERAEGVPRTTRKRACLQQQTASKRN